MKYDTHAHLDLYKNREDIFRFIEKERLYTICMTNLPVLFEKYINLYGNYKYIRFSLGFHPELVKNNIKQLPIFLRNIKKARYIGEIGLDYTNIDSETKTDMRKVFSTIVEECNNYNNKILSVHSRKAANDVIRIIGRFNGKVILHWFTGNMKELNYAINNGYYFSINHHMASSKFGIKIINSIPIDKILVESDAPFTKGLKTKYTLDFYYQIINSLSVELNIDKLLLEKQLFSNFRTLLK